MRVGRHRRQNLYKLMRRPVAVQKTDLVLLTLHACNGRPVSGITRLVKLIFLIQAGERPAGGRPGGACHDDP